MLDHDDFLIDDYTQNLIEWESKGGRGIKFLNGINHTHQTWKGMVIKDYDGIREQMQSLTEERLLPRNDELLENFKKRHHGMSDEYFNAVERKVDSIASNIADREKIMKTVLAALDRNQTSIRAVMNISKENLVMDAGNNYSKNLYAEMQKVLKNYEIGVISRNEFISLCEDYSSYPNGIYVCLDYPDEIIAVDNTASEMYSESFKSIDEAIAYLGYDLELSLIKETDNPMLQQILDEEGYTEGKSEVERRNKVEEVYEQIKEFGINELDRRDISSLDKETLDAIDMHFNEMRRLAVKICNIAERENDEKDIEYEMKL